MKQLGNNSRYAVSWRGGPIYETKPQHIPGYTGFVPKVIAENVYGKTYGKSTAKAIQGNFEVGTQISKDERFQT
jgi:hypothetical protein